MVDRNGNTTTYAYNSTDQLMTITDPVGLVTTLSYQGGLLASVTDPGGRTTRFEHDPDRNLQSIIDPDGSHRQFAYDAEHRMTSQISKRGFETTYTLNFAGRYIGAVRPDGSTMDYMPQETIGLIDPASGLGTRDHPAPAIRERRQVATFTDGIGNTTIFETNEFAAAEDVTDALGQTTRVETNADGLPTRIRRPNGAVLLRTYDERGNLLTTTEESIEATTTFTYEPTFNQPTGITDPNLNTTQLQYDERGNLITTINAKGVHTQFEYDDPRCPGQVTRIIVGLDLPEESLTSTEYDQATCNLTRTIDPLNRVTTLEYDTAGNVTFSIDAKERRTQFLYDTMNRVTEVKDPQQGHTKFAYDAQGNLLRITDAKEQSIHFEYDKLNRLMVRIDPLRRRETFTYDDGCISFATTGVLFETTGTRFAQLHPHSHHIINSLVRVSTFLNA